LFTKATKEHLYLVLWTLSFVYVLV